MTDKCLTNNLPIFELYSTQMPKYILRNEIENNEKSKEMHKLLYKKINFKKIDLNIYDECFFKNLYPKYSNDFHMFMAKCSKTQTLDYRNKFKKEVKQIIIRFD